jgi:hypothetical protein
MFITDFMPIVLRTIPNLKKGSWLLVDTVKLFL